MLQHVTMMQLQKKIMDHGDAAEGLDCDGNCLSGDLLTMNDSYGDGWNGALTINGVDYTITSGASATACIDLEGCNSMLQDLEVHGMMKSSWIYQQTYPLTRYQMDLAGAAGDQFGDCVYGCTDASATNYNADADVSDDSCVYALVPEAWMLQHVIMMQLQSKIMDSCEYPAPNTDCEEHLFKALKHLQ